MSANPKYDGVPVTTAADTDRVPLGRKGANEDAIHVPEVVVRPAEGQQRELRNVFGAFATGVTVVSINTADGPTGMTVNSFSSVSLDPALVLWSVAKSSARRYLFETAEYFAVNVLARDQEDVAMAFAKDAAAFNVYPYDTGGFDSPVLAGCVASFECRRHACHDGGDHTIIVGEIMQATLHDRDPLLFQRGFFGSLGKPVA